MNASIPARLEIESEQDQRFFAEPWNYRFIVWINPQTPDEYEATSFEMPGVNVQAETSHEALNALALYLAGMDPEELEPTSRREQPSITERSRFLPVDWRLVRREALEQAKAEQCNLSGFIYHEPVEGWVRLNGIDAHGDESHRRLMQAIDRAETAMWLNPPDGPDQATSIHNVVYEGAGTSLVHRRWPRRAVERILQADEDQDASTDRRRGILHDNNRRQKGHGRMPGQPGGRPQPGHRGTASSLAGN